MSSHAASRLREHTNCIAQVMRPKVLSCRSSLGGIATSILLGPGDLSRPVVVEPEERPGWCRVFLRFHFRKHLHASHLDYPITSNITGPVRILGWQCLLLVNVLLMGVCLSALPSCANPPPPSRETPLSQQPQVLFPQILDLSPARGSFPRAAYTKWGGIGGTQVRPAPASALILAAVLPSISTLPLELGNRESADDQYIYDAMVTSCVFSGCAQTAPLSERHSGVVSVNTWDCSVALTRGARGVTLHCKPPRCLNQWPWSCAAVMWSLVRNPVGKATPAWDIRRSNTSCVIRCVIRCTVRPRPAPAAPAERMAMRLMAGHLPVPPLVPPPLPPSRNMIGRAGGAGKPS